MANTATKFVVNSAEGVTLLNTNGESVRIKANQEGNVADYDHDSLIALTLNGKEGYTKTSRDKKVVIYSPSISLIGDAPVKEVKEKKATDKK